MTKKRYIVANRFGPGLSQRAHQQLQSFVASTKDAALGKRTSVGRQVVYMTHDHMRDLAAKNRDLVVEEDRELTLFPMPGLPPVISLGDHFARTVHVKDATTGAPIPYVTIYGIGTGPAYKAETDPQGGATLVTNEASLVRLIASPRDTYWSRVIEGVSMTDENVLDITLKPLLVTGAYSWGHRLMGFRSVSSRWTGRSVKIGIIDSGISDRLQDLKPTGGYNTLDGQDSNAWQVDEKGHGTHCAGIVAALNNTIGVRGGAPGAAIYSLKVFPGGYVSDLVEAIEWCVRNRMDIMSMSLGSPVPSQVLAGALYDAYIRGVTCIAAVGNERTRVAYPAGFPTVIGVSALGRFGTFPEDSAHHLKIGSYVDWRGELFAANFTNFGPEVEVCAPGVAMLSTVPTGYASWDGTSFSCPLVSALAALILEAYPLIRTGDTQQPEFVRAILRSAATDLGLPRPIQGYGLPLVPYAFAAAERYGLRGAQSPMWG